MSVPTQPDPVLDILDRILADVHQLSAEVNRLVLEYGNLRRDHAAKLVDTTPRRAAS